jgi:hypothetical protein
VHLLLSHERRRILPRFRASGNQKALLTGYSLSAR